MQEKGAAGPRPEGEAEGATSERTRSSELAQAHWRLEGFQEAWGSDTPLKAGSHLWPAPRSRKEFQTRPALRPQNWSVHRKTVQAPGESPPTSCSTEQSNGDIHESGNAAAGKEAAASSSLHTLNRPC